MEDKNVLRKEKEKSQSSQKELVSPSPSPSLSSRTRTNVNPLVTEENEENRNVLRKEINRTKKE
jgi:hypothetical protein